MVAAGPWLRLSGAVVRQMSVARKQRGAKAQPAGKRASEGVAPGIWTSIWPGVPAEGSEPSRPLV
jgi:hypothetical protein